MFASSSSSTFLFSKAACDPQLRFSTDSVASLLRRAFSWLSACSNLDLSALFSEASWELTPRSMILSFSALARAPVASASFSYNERSKSKNKRYLSVYLNVFSARCAM